MSNPPCCTLIESAYFPSIEYFMAAADTGVLIIEACESYIKQTYRNRCRIYACDGILPLTVPVTFTSPSSRSMADARVDYSKPWLQQHKRALISAYNTSAFFEYYRDDIFEILDRRIESLLELNVTLIEKMLVLLGFRCQVQLTQSYKPIYGPDILDLRGIMTPKKPITELFAHRYKPYYQVFSAKSGFIPGLSALDLLFNEGPSAITFLTST